MNCKKGEPQWILCGVMNFLCLLSTQGPELLSKWLGESEKALQALFKKARAAGKLSLEAIGRFALVDWQFSSTSSSSSLSSCFSPSIAPTVIFFDEIDALAGRRGGSNDSKASERVLSQLLTGNLMVTWDDGMSMGMDTLGV